MLDRLWERAVGESDKRQAIVHVGQVRPAFLRLSNQCLSFGKEILSDQEMRGQYGGLRAIGLNVEEAREGSPGRIAVTRVHVRHGKSVKVVGIAGIPRDGLLQ